MKNSIIPTLSDIFEQINQKWAQLSLKRDLMSISKITFVPCFVLALWIEKVDDFSQKRFFLKSSIIFLKKNIIHPTDHIQSKITMILIKVSKNRNGFLKTLFLPKSNAIILRISDIYIYMYVIEQKSF